MRIELLCLALVIACVGAEITGYTTRYDHINLDDILYNNRLLKNYYNCMVGVGRCTADATKLKCKLLTEEDGHLVCFWCECSSSL